MAAGLDLSSSRKTRRGGQLLGRLLRHHLGIGISHTSPPVEGMRFEDVVRRVKTDPETIRRKDLNPRVAGSPADECRVCRRCAVRGYDFAFDVTAHVTRRDARAPAETDHQVRKVLADAFFLREKLRDSCPPCGDTAPIFEVFENPRV